MVEEDVDGDDDDDDDEGTGKVLYIIDIQSGEIIQRAHFDLKGAATEIPLWTATRSSSRSTLLARSWYSSSRGPRREWSGAWSWTLDSAVRYLL